MTNATHDCTGCPVSAGTHKPADAVHTEIEEPSAAAVPAPQAALASEEMRVCNNDECGWIGPLSETYGYKHSSAMLCPECKETTELSAPAHPAEGGQ